MERSLRDLIARLPIPGLQESTNRHVIADVLTKTLNIPIKPKQINCKDGVITVSVPPIVKSAIQLKQTQLLDLLSKEGISVRICR